jgi:predicted TIM-barrel enzyme
MWRVSAIFDTPLLDYKNTKFQDVSTQQRPVNRTIPVIHGSNQTDVPMRNAKTLRGSLGDYEFSGRQLDQIEAIIEAGDGKMRRDTSSLGRGLAEIGITTGQYPIIYQAAKERGLIGQDDKWTMPGIEWVKAP